jgi:hypothetical protein
MYVIADIFLQKESYPGKQLTIKIKIMCYSVAEIGQSVKRLATGWKIWGSNPGGGEIFRTRPHGPWSSSILLYNGYRISFPKVKRGVDHPPHLLPRLNKKLNYTSTPSLGLRGLF